MDICKELVEIFQVVMTSQLNGHDNFLIVPKGKTQVNISGGYRQGVLNLDCILESSGELSKNSDARSHPQRL